MSLRVNRIVFWAALLSVAIWSATAEAQRGRGGAAVVAPEVAAVAAGREQGAVVRELGVAAAHE